MKRRVRAEEQALWNAAMRGVRRLSFDVVSSVPPPSVHAASQPRMPTARELLPSRIAAMPSSPAPSFLDGDTDRRLQKGVTSIDARLDLHGMTERDAHTALIRRIEQSMHRGHRIVLVVTGKGRLGKGVLRRNLPLWLDAPALRPHITGYRPAFTRDGGDGAVYILLRRPVRRD